MARLTKLEKEMLHRAAMFVLAHLPDEWPWEDEGSPTKDTREQAALISAASKIARPTPAAEGG